MQAPVAIAFCKPKLLLFIASPSSSYHLQALVAIAYASPSGLYSLQAQVALSICKPQWLLPIASPSCFCSLQAQVALTICKPQWLLPIASPSGFYSLQAQVALTICKPQWPLPIANTKSCYTIAFAFACPSGLSALIACINQSIFAFLRASFLYIEAFDQSFTHAQRSRTRSHNHLNSDSLLMFLALCLHG